MADEETPETPEEQPRASSEQDAAPSEETPQSAAEPETPEPAAEEPVAEEPAAEEPAPEQPAAEEATAEEPVAEEPAAAEPAASEQAPAAEEDEEGLVEPISTAAIDLASGARYRATGKRKTAIARVTLRPGTGTYLVNGRILEEHFPRVTLQRNIRQPLEAVGYQERMDVVARLHGGGISAQAGALRHGVSRALLEADPNLRGELKRRGFLTRDSRAKERKKAGLKKARKRPQFSKR